MSNTGSGPGRVFINTRARALSSDINNVSCLGQKAQAELVRWLVDVSGGDYDVSATSAQVQSLSQQTPSDGGPGIGGGAVIVGPGFCVRVTSGSNNITVDGGMLAIVDATALPGPYDSCLFLVQDAGVASGAPLTLSANGSGSARWDVVECSRVPAGITTYESVDLFSTSTGTFSASSLPVYLQDTLSYRIRLGTAGSGFPAAQTGWFPLAVMLVPGGASSMDAVSVWDVRNLLSDRPDSISNVTSAHPRRLAASINGINPAAITGSASHVYGGRRVGGSLLRGSPGADASSWDSTDVANQATDIGGVTTGQLVSIALVFPAGLPRWARYASAGSAGAARNPRNPIGIPILTAASVGADSSVSGITLPTAFAMGSATCSGVAIASAFWHSGALSAFYTSDGETFSQNAPAIAMAIVSSKATATLVAGTDFPQNAKSVRVQTVPSFVTGGAGQCTCLTSVSAPGVTTVVFTAADNFAVGGASETISPFLGNWFALTPATGAGASYTFATGTFGSGAGTPTSGTLSVLGWTT